MRVAIIGAGMTGASAANQLRLAGAEVVVFDKARGPGGRMSSKRVESMDAAAPFYALDFGAQYFTARHPLFMQALQGWLAQGVVQRWEFDPYVWQHGLLLPSNDGQSRYVSTPTMHQLVKTILGDTTLHLNCRITELSFSQSSFSSQHGGEWTLSSAEGASYPGFDAVILTCPPEQCRQLLAEHPLAMQIPPALLLPCWAVSLQLHRAVDHPADGIFVKEGPLSWCARQSAKPGRTGMTEQWLLHFNASTSLQLLEASPEELVALAQLEFSAIIGQKVESSQSICHRWLYASFNPAQPAPGLLTDKTQQLILAGDWSLGGRVENAYLAGLQAAASLVPESLTGADLSAVPNDSMLETAIVARH